MPVKGASKKVSVRKQEALTSPGKPPLGQEDQGQALAPAGTVIVSGEGMQVDEERGVIVASGPKVMPPVVATQTPPAPLAPTSSGVNGHIESRPGPSPLPSAPVSGATSFMTTPAPPVAMASDFATEQQRWKTTLAKIADQYIEAASVSDVSNPDVVRGILAMAIKSSGLKLP